MIKNYLKHAGLIKSIQLLYSPEVDICKMRVRSNQISLKHL